MDSLYFIIRAGLVLAVLAVGMFWIGMLVGRFIWRDEETRLAEIENQNRELECERDRLRESGAKSPLE